MIGLHVRIVLTILSPIVDILCVCVWGGETYMTIFNVHDNLSFDYI